jgi:hypothetical protein
LAKLFKQRHLFNTRGTPGGPEIDHLNMFAFRLKQVLKLLELYYFSLLLSLYAHRANRKADNQEVSHSY